MPCYNPLKGYRSQTVNPSGKRSISFSPKEGFHDLRIDIPCGQCIGCRLERSRQWAIRCVHESKLYEDNCFVTLTYRDENLPKGGSLVKEDFQKFMKRLRTRIEDSSPSNCLHRFKGGKVRYFHCGEYGEKFARPHYHACLFNVDFDDRVLLTIQNGNELHVSEELNSLWPQGFSTIGRVTFESAAYVARYITKKITGRMAEQYYEYEDENGEFIGRQPEYVTMSRRPGIGKGWYDKFKTDLFNGILPVGNRNGELVVSSPPKFYLSKLELEHPEHFSRIKTEKRVKGEKRAWDNTYERLAVREIIQYEKLKNCKRNYEDGT